MQFNFFQFSPAKLKRSCDVARTLSRRAPLPVSPHSFSSTCRRRHGSFSPWDMAWPGLLHSPAQALGTRIRPSGGDGWRKTPGFPI